MKQKPQKADSAKIVSFGIELINALKLLRLGQVVAPRECVNILLRIEERVQAAEPTMAEAKRFTKAVTDAIPDIQTADDFAARMRAEAESQ